MAFRIFIRSLTKSLSEIPFQDLTEANYEYLFDKYITNQPVLEAFEEIYLRIGLTHGAKVGKAINKYKKEFNPFSFDIVYREFVKRWVTNNSGKKITSVRQSLIGELIKLFRTGIEENLSVREIAANIKNLVGKGKLFNWQAMRIARTETTGAANLGALKAGEQSGVQLTKEWISTVDKRTRRKPKDEFDHLDMDGVVIDEKELFNVNGDFLEFPGDPKGEAANIINCRCTIALMVKRDSNGNIIFKP